MPKKCTLETDSVLSLQRRGVWDAKKFPIVAAFMALPKPEQDKVAVTFKRGGGLCLAMEVVPASTVTK